MKKPVIKNPFKSVTRNKRIPIIVAVVLIVAATVTLVKVKLVDGKSKALELQTATATLRDLRTTITGSGPIISSNLTTVAFKANGTITKINFKEGEAVKKGQVICTLDKSDIDNNIAVATNNLKDTQKSLNENLENYANLNVKAPMNGQVISLAVKEGDEVQKNGTLFTIVNSGKMKLTVPFNGGDISSIKIGDKVQVNLQNTMQTISGRVVYKSNAPYSNQTDGNLYNVEIEVVNQGTLSEGTSASADIEKAGKTISSTQTGTLEFNEKKVVKSASGGTVEKINIRQYDKVSSGFVVLRMSNDELISTIDDARVKLSEATEQLAKAKEQLEYYTIKAPIAGVATTLSLKTGDTTKAGDTLTTITDNSKMEFEVTVDELDIAKIKIGQKVNVTLDAITQTSTIPLSGEVSKISVDGTSSNGVTTYPITIKITGVNTSSIANMMRNRNFNSSTSTGTGQTSTAGSNNWQSRRNQTNSTTNQTPAGGQFPSGQMPSNQYKGANNSGINSSNGNGNAGNFGGSGTRTRVNVQDMLSQLKDGMNANAEIIISENSNILTVPLEAIVSVGRTSYVMVQSDAKTIAELKKNGKYTDLFSTNTSSGVSGNSNSNTNRTQSRSYGGNSSNRAGSTYMSSALNRLKQNEDYYKNAIPTEVQIGVNNDTYVQITSGLKEGQIILLPPVTVTSSTSTSGNNAGAGGFGGLMGTGGGDFQNRQNINRNNSGQSSSGNGGTQSKSSGSGGGN